MTRTLGGLSPASAFILAATLLTTACTTELEVRRAPSGTAEGMPYALPRKSFLVSAEYTLRRCEVVLHEDKDKKEKPRSMLHFDVAKQVKLTPVTEQDEQDRFLIPYAALRSWFKDTDITIENYENQTLKGINAGITDKTGEIIAAGIGTALRVASLVGSVALLEAQQETLAQATRRFCHARARDTFAEIKALEEQRKKAGTDEEKADLTQRIADIRADRLTYKEAAHWTPRHGALTIDLYPKEFLTSNWITAAGLQQYQNQGMLDDDGRITQLVTQVALSFPSGIPAASAPLADNVKGLVLRNPVPAIVRACTGPCPTQNPGPVGSVLLASDETIPQLGPYVIMPLSNGLFEDSKLELALSQQGALTKLAIKSNAEVEKALTSTNADLDMLMKAKAAREKHKAEIRTTEENKAVDTANAVRDKNTAIAGCLAAQKSLQEAGGTPIGTCQ